MPACAEAPNACRTQEGLARSHAAGAYHGVLYAKGTAARKTDSLAVTQLMHITASCAKGTAARKTDSPAVTQLMHITASYEKGTAARKTDSPAVTQLMRITARAEGAIMDGWMRIIEDRLDASPATALQKLGTGQMLPMSTESNSTESKSASWKMLRARLKDKRLRRLDAPPARGRNWTKCTRAPIYLYGPFVEHSAGPVQAGGAGRVAWSPKWARR
jgi:hypothetical protein